MHKRWQDFAKLRNISPSDALFSLLVALFYFLRPNNAGFPHMPVGSFSTLNTGLFVVIGLAYSLPLLWRSKAPAISAIFVLLAWSIRYLIEPTGIIFADLAGLLALYSVAYRSARWVSSAALGFIIFNIAFQNLYILFPGGRFSSEQSILLTYIGTIIQVSAVVCAVYFLGGRSRAERQRIHQLELLTQKVQLRAENEADLAVLEERSRIARDMHDVVAHTLSVVIAQADGGRYAAAKDPHAPLKALNTIAEMTRDALKDIRSIIGVLRESDSGEHPTLPSPIDQDIMELVSTVQESGVTISFTRMGKMRPLPAGIGNAVYRICQEAITNSLKHAGLHPIISVLLQTTDANLVLQIDDDGRGAAAISDGKGHGLVGMSERTAAFGGSLVSGPRSSGGYRVTATIPLPPEES